MTDILSSNRESYLQTDDAAAKHIFIVTSHSVDDICYMIMISLVGTCGNTTRPESMRLLSVFYGPHRSGNTCPLITVVELIHFSMFWRWLQRQTSNRTPFKCCGCRIRCRELKFSQAWAAIHPENESSVFNAYAFTSRSAIFNILLVTYQTLIMSWNDFKNYGSPCI